MDVISTDVAIIGAGGAGLRAAIAVAETDPTLGIWLISKVYPMRSHTVAAEGGAAGVIKDNDSLDYHFHDTVSGGDWLCDQDAVELFVNAAPLELMQLEHWGCPWSREASGKVAVRPFGGMKIERTSCGHAGVGRQQLGWGRHRAPGPDATTRKADSRGESSARGWVEGPVW